MRDIVKNLKLWSDTLDCGHSVVNELMKEAADLIIQQQDQINKISKICLSNREISEIKAVQAEESFIAGIEWCDSRITFTMSSARIFAKKMHADRIREDV